ncbi:MAG: hypothetical protein CMC55_04305 [Flavobacteriaceae bacterium]|nr:hypothetical protein [Flavobacteriaceae bacterium]
MYKDYTEQPKIKVNFKKSHKPNYSGCWLINYQKYAVFIAKYAMFVLSITDKKVTGCRELLKFKT